MVNSDIETLLRLCEWCLNTVFVLRVPLWDTLTLHVAVMFCTVPRSRVTESRYGFVTVRKLSVWPWKAAVCVDAVSLAAKGFWLFLRETGGMRFWCDFEWSCKFSNSSVSFSPAETSLWDTLFWNIFKNICSATDLSYLRPFDHVTHVFKTETADSHVWRHCRLPVGALI